MAENSIRSMILREARNLMPNVYAMKVVSSKPLEMVTEGDAPIHVSEDSLIVPQRLREKMVPGATFYALSIMDANQYYVLDEA